MRTDIVKPEQPKKISTPTSNKTPRTKMINLSEALQMVEEADVAAK